MNKNRLWIAVIILLGLGGAAASAMRTREAETSVEKPSATLPTLKQEDITSLELQNPGKGSVSLSKQDGTWSIISPVTAKADQAAVESMLEKLAALEVKGVAASRKENHARLEVDDAQAVRVKVSAGDKPLLTLFIGASKGAGTLVRAEGKDEVLNVKGAFRHLFDKDLKLLRDRVILDIDAQNLTTLKLTSAKGTFSFEKADGKWSQTLAKGEKPVARFSDAKVQSLSSTLGRLRAADFAEAAETPESLGFDAPSASAILTLADGTTHTLQLGKESGVSGEYALRLEGNDIIYRIAKHNAERLLADASAFQEAEQKPGAQAPTPPDMGGGNQEIPPEVLRQLQQQLGQGGMGGMGGGH